MSKQWNETGQGTLYIFEKYIDEFWNKAFNGFADIIHRNSRNIVRFFDTNGNRLGYFIGWDANNNDVIDLPGIFGDIDIVNNQPVDYKIEINNMSSQPINIESDLTDINGKKMRPGQQNLYFNIPPGHNHYINLEGDTSPDAQGLNVRLAQYTGDPTRVQFAGNHSPNVQILFWNNISATDFFVFNIYDENR